MARDPLSGRRKTIIACSPMDFFAKSRSDAETWVYMPSDASLMISASTVSFFQKIVFWYHAWKAG